MSLPTGYDDRKNFPLLTFLTAYFPDAIEAMVALSVQGNVQHEVDSEASNPFKLPGDKITWDRRKSKDELNTAMRHMWDHARALRGGFPDQLVDVDGHLHIVKAAWRACAEAQKTIEHRKLDKALARTDVGDALEKFARSFDPGRPAATAIDPRGEVRLSPPAYTFGGGASDFQGATDLRIRASVCPELHPQETGPVPPLSADLGEF